ncbi:hypothetical protein [Parasitella parasitica]|uniref:Uncharacterized protein n=1 Tax=Parasitella parasitica TaxID=35722 RepID=A0A0B7N389_9FUNG|nr:hypothetical protein [Parasitella parasitica]
MEVQLCSSGTFSGVNLHWSEKYIQRVETITAFLAPAALNSGTISEGTMYCKWYENGQNLVLSTKATFHFQLPKQNEDDRLCEFLWYFQ